MNVYHVTQEQYNTITVFIALLFLHLSESHSLEEDIGLYSLVFLKPEWKNVSGGIRGKEKTNLNEQLKANKLKIKGPQIGVAQTGLESKSVEPGI